jgi:hypothetical protein
MSDIEPVDKTTTKTITRFSLDISKMTLNESATFRVSMFDVNDKYIDATNVTLEGQAYLDWGNDDTYVINYVATTLGFILSTFEKSGAK